jgi:shikimate kinase
MGEFICLLIGPYGSGKTTVGRMLADFLSITFIDIDKEVENLSGKNIVELFKENGYEKIAQIEQKILNDLVRKKNFILAVSVNSIDTCAKNSLININKKNKLNLNTTLDASSNENSENFDNSDNSRLIGLTNNKVKNRVVYLAANPTNQYIRSMLSSKPSPILLTLENKLQYLTELTKKMEPIYNSMADFIVNTDNYLVEEVVNKIIDYLYCSAYS